MERESYNKREVDIYCSHPKRNFKKTQEALRIRKSNQQRYTITYKKPISSRLTKTRREYNVEVKEIEDIEKLSQILEALGFKPVEKIVKSREIWRLKHAIINLDNVSSLGRFV